MFVLGVMLVVLPREPGLSAGMENLDLFIAEEELEFYEEVDFYRWLVQERLRSGELRHPDSAAEPASGTVNRVPQSEQLGNDE